ncbi:MAG: hypothetical protein WCD18_08320 [Thermosynechococcaceae cyanobacterium]
MATVKFSNILAVQANLTCNGRLHDNRNAILKAQQQGLQQGIQQGIQEGDRQARIRIAHQLLDVLEVDLIAQKTGLTVEEIQQLK